MVTLSYRAIMPQDGLSGNIALALIDPLFSFSANKDAGLRERLTSTIMPEVGAS